MTTDKAMTVLIGEFGGTKSQMLPHLVENGWGRMWASFGPQWSYPDEPWGFDNGAFACWKNGHAFDGDKFIRRMRRAIELSAYPPIVAVVPDIVANGLASLALSEEWLRRNVLCGGWPWFLAVQDGVCPERVRCLLPLVSGLFLGGTDAFKATAQSWCELAHRNDKLFHFARCNREGWIRNALDIGADSIDTTRPIRALTAGEIGRFRLFRKLVTGKCNQKYLPW